MGEVSKESSLQRPSVRCGEQASWVPGQTPLGSAAKEQWEWGGRLQLMSGKMFQWQRLFKRKPEWGDRGFRSRCEAGPIPKIGEFHEHLKTNPRP